MEVDTGSDSLIVRDVDTGSDSLIVRDVDTALKTRCLSSRAADQHAQDQLTQLQLPATENGFVSNQSADTVGSQVSLETSHSHTSEIEPRDDITAGNQSADTEGSQVSLETRHSGNTEIVPRDGIATGSSSVDAEDDRHAISECVSDSVVDGLELAPNRDISPDIELSATNGDEVAVNHNAVAVGRAGENTFDDQHSHAFLEKDNGHGRNTSSENMLESGSQDGFMANSEVEDRSLHETSNVTSTKKPGFHVLGSGSPLDIEVICLDEDGESRDNDSSTMEVGVDCQNVNGMKGASQKRDGTGDEVSQSGTVKGRKAMNFGKTNAATTKPGNSVENFVYVDEESRHSEMQAGLDGQNNTDDEKENKGTCRSSSDTKDVAGERNKYQKMDLPGKESKKKDNDSDSADDEVEIIGESKVVQTNKPTRPAHTSQNIVFVPASLTSVNQNHVAHSNGGQLLPSAQSSTLVSSAAPTSAMFQILAPGNSSQRMPSLNPNFAVAGGIQAQQQQKLQVMFSSVAPPKPQSSLDQIELIRWEIQNRINTRAKYFKPNPSAELGSLATFLFNIGSDLIKEAVYHDLVKIQSKKKNKNKLNDKEKEDLGKLKEIEKDLYATIGHLKTRLKKRCSMCDFRTESINVMFQHNQFPHEDSKGMKCSLCSFTTKQAIGFRYHMESKHGVAPKLHDKKATFECEFCPYENNNEQKLKLHKQRCIKQFRPYFNLHPSCLSGPEISLCLDNIFYKQVVPKNVSVPQQRHSQVQAPMTNAQKQQAERKSLIAAQKTTAALTANKQLPQKVVPPTKVMAYNVPANGRMPVPVKLTPSQPQPMRFGPNAGTRISRPTIANILNTQQNSVPQASVIRNPAPPLGTFEVCEICGGFVKDRKALRIHFFYAHRIDLPFNLFERNQAPLYCATCYVRFWTAQGLRKHIDSHKEGNQSRGVVGKCILCSHHVLNLLLHMRLVHNRDMQHYLNLNMCMFCGVKTASRHECENHINNIHGHVDPISGTIKPPSNAVSQPPTQQPQKTLEQPKKAVINTSKKRCMCVLCNLEFSRNVDLTRHCMRVHHTCMKCGMVVADKPSLLKHVCLVSSSGVRDCDVCGDKGYHPAYYVKHLRDRHLKKLSIQLVRLSKQTIEQWTKQPYPAAEPETEQPHPAAEAETEQPRPAAEAETEQPRPAAEAENILVEISDDDDDVHPGEQQKSLLTNSAENIQNNASANESGKNNKELADCERDTGLADQAAGPVEVIDIDTAQEFSEDNRSSETVQGHKRRAESPIDETSPKRPKTP